MGDVVSEARVAVLRWKRGTGYYGAHKHDTPYSWEDFRHNMSDTLLPIAKRRYEAYVLSWLLSHDGELDPIRLDKAHGVTILARVKMAVAHEVEYRKTWERKKVKK